MGKLSSRRGRKSQPTVASKPNGLGPSKLLMTAAMSGLLGMNGACDDDPPAEQEDPDTREDAGSIECAAVGGNGGRGGRGGSGGAADAGPEARPDASAGPDEVDKEISTSNVQHTYAELTALCNDRKGYVEVLGSCSGVNSCQGFTYGDWGEDSQLIEHTCAGANGCAGLSCVIPAREESTRDMTGEEIIKLDDAWYEERGGAYGPKACRTCHIESEHNDATGDYDYDYTKLRVPVMPGSGRTANNWTERPAAYQESVVAFGLTHISEKDGSVFTSMVSYAKLFSKEEIRRVVEHMRGYEPENIIIKELVLEPGKQAD